MSGKLAGAMDFINRIGFLIETFQNRNRLLWWLGLLLLVLWIILSYLIKNQYIKHKRWNNARIWSFFLALFCILLCFTAGAGNGIGFGQGSGIGIGDGVGIGGGDGVASVSTSMDGAEKQTIETEIKNAIEANELLIRVRGVEIFFGNYNCQEDELEDVLSDRFTDGMNVVLQDDYADDQTFKSVLKILEGLGIVAVIETL